MREFANVYIGMPAFEKSKLQFTIDPFGVLQTEDKEPLWGKSPIRQLPDVRVIESTIMWNSILIPFIFVSIFLVLYRYRRNVAWVAARRKETVRCHNCEKPISVVKGESVVSCPDCGQDSAT